MQLHQKPIKNHLGKVTDGKKVKKIFRQTTEASWADLHAEANQAVSRRENPMKGQP